MPIKFKFILFIALCHLTVNAQNWSSWTSIQNTNNALQYSYKLYPVSSGNSFSFKIKNNSLAVACGEFEVNLNMVNGAKKLSYSFKDLKSGIEKSCPGVYQFADVQSFGSVTNVKINDCGETGSDASTDQASFTVDYHNEASKGGVFKFVDPKGQYSFVANASSGHLKAANNPYTQQYKNSPDNEKKHGKPMEGYGTIPSGTWFITGIKNKDLIKLILTPGPDIVNPYGRKDFEIHGNGKNEDASESSTGCIILDRVYREKLMKVFLRDGKIKLKIENKMY